MNKEADDILNDYKEKADLNLINKSRFREQGVIISFLYTNNSFQCGIEGCKSIFQMYRIYQLVVALVNMFNTFDLGKEDNNTLKILSSNIENTESLFKEIEEQYVH